jgi:DNA-binding NarL/FixJ family response regulator
MIEWDTVTPQEQAMANGRILIVDDDPIVLLIFGDTLRKLGDGYEIVTSSGGMAALQEIRDRHFDLVITDLSMPDVGGIELTETIQGESPGTAIVWITAYGCQNVFREAARLAIHGCYDKPLEVSEILQLAREALADQPHQRVS